MSKSALAEIYFIAGAMVLILIICVGSVYIFVRQLRREKRKSGNSDPIGTDRAANTEE